MTFTSTANSNPTVTQLMKQINEPQNQITQSEYEITIHSDSLIKKKNNIIVNQQKQLELEKQLAKEQIELAKEQIELERQSLLHLVNYVDSIKNTDDLTILQGKLGYLVRQTRLNYGV